MINNLHCHPLRLFELRSFIAASNLQPGDVIITKQRSKGIYDLMEHYIIYLGGDYFMANYQEGTKILTCPVIYKFRTSMTVNRIRRFKGNWLDRQTAVQQALKYQDRDSYHLIVNNCEHFANEIQFGKSFSDQVMVTGALATIGGLAMMASKNSFLQIAGGVLAALGGIATGIEITRRTV